MAAIWNHARTPSRRYAPSPNPTRVVFDTNVIASRFISPQGPPAQLFDLWQQQVFELLVSEPILAEYEGVLQYEMISLHHRMSAAQIHQVIEDFREFATLVSPRAHLTVIAEDPPDNRFLECAVEGGALFIVSGDHHLLDLGHYRGIQVLLPKAFLSLLEQPEEQEGAA